MVRGGELLTFSFEGKEVKCRVEKVAEDLSSFTVVDQANTLRLGKPCDISITRPDGIESGKGIVVDIVKASEQNEDKKNSRSPGMLEYLVSITTPFQKIQKRNFFRYECYMPVVLFGIDDSNTHNSHIIDLSAGGAKVLTNNRFVLNKILNIVFFLGKKETHLFGVVLGIDEAPESSDYNFIMRLKFTQTTKKDEDNIVKFIFSEYRKIARKRAGKDL